MRLIRNKHSIFLGPLGSYEERVVLWTKNTQNFESAVGGSKPNTINSFIHKAVDMLDTYAIK